MHLYVREGLSGWTMADSQLSEQMDPLPLPGRKAAYVRAMFGRIARRYDMMNRVMTLGQDRAWRRHTVEKAVVPPTGRVLDVATGTGDLALEVLRQRPDAQVVGIDFALEMLGLAQHKASGLQADVSLLVGDALCLPFADGSFDTVVTAFALRNVTDIPAAFSEMARVTRAGGRVACLEIASPRLPLFRNLFTFYFYRLVPLLGGWITGQRSAYTYLPHSLTAFLAPDEILNVMRGAGWCGVSYQRLTFGSVAVHTAYRP